MQILDSKTILVFDQHELIVLELYSSEGHKKNDSRGIYIYIYKYFEED